MSQEIDVSSRYDDTHRTLLQAFIARQCLTAEETQSLLASIVAVEDGNENQDIETYIHAINNRISPYDLEIRSTRHQRKNVTIYALVNNTSDPLMQMATTHSADEIAFVRRLLDAMFETYNTPRAELMAITSMQALKLAKPPEGPAGPITGAQAEEMLKAMVTEGWFEQRRVDETKYYLLAPRALLELRDWLLETYNDEGDEDEEDVASNTKIKTCAACKEIVTIGQRCSRRTCLGRLHGHCSERMFRAQGNREVCPLCETPWDSHLPVGP